MTCQSLHFPRGRVHSADSGRAQPCSVRSLLHCWVSFCSLRLSDTTHLWLFTWLQFTVHMIRLDFLSILWGALKEPQINLSFSYLLVKYIAVSACSGLSVKFSGSGMKQCLESQGLGQLQAFQSWAGAIQQAKGLLEQNSASRTFCISVT